MRQELISPNQGGGSQRTKKGKWDIFFLFGEGEGIGGGIFTSSCRGLFFYLFCGHVLKDFICHVPPDVRSFKFLHFFPFLHALLRINSPCGVIRYFIFFVFFFFNFVSFMFCGQKRDVRMRQKHTTHKCPHPVFFIFLSKQGYILSTLYTFFSSEKKVYETIIFLTSQFFRCWYQLCYISIALPTQHCPSVGKRQPDRTSSSHRHIFHATQRRCFFDVCTVNFPSLSPPTLPTAIIPPPPPPPTHPFFFHSPQLLIITVSRFIHYP